MVILPPEGTLVLALKATVMAAVLTMFGNWSAEAMVIAVTEATWLPSLRVNPGRSEEAPTLKVVKVLAPAPVVTAPMTNVISIVPRASAAVLVVQTRMSALATSRIVEVPEPVKAQLATAVLSVPPTLNVLSLEESAAVKYVAGVAM